MRPILLLFAASLAALTAVPGPASAQAVATEPRTGSEWTGQRVRVTLDRHAVGEVRQAGTFTGEVVLAGGDSLVVLPERTNTLMVLRRQDVRRMYVAAKPEPGTAGRNGMAGVLIGALVGGVLDQVMPGDGSANRIMDGVLRGAAVGVLFGLMDPTSSAWRRVEFPAAFSEADPGHGAGAKPSVLPAETGLP